MKITLFLLSTAAITAWAAEPTPGLPPAEIVARVLRNSPAVQAAASQIRVEESNRSRLEAGPHEWNLRLGGQQRRYQPATGAEGQFNEWNAAIERPLRLPGKSALDAELGASGVSLASTAYGDALHEASRNLLKAWFVWRREQAAASQWTTQVALLEQQASAVSRRQQVGDAARLESVQAAAALAQARAQLAQAQVREQTASEDLRRRYPGLPLQAPPAVDIATPLSGTAAEWIDAIIAHSHELGLAQGEAQRARLLAGRAGSDRLPDPTIGLHVARERAGEDRIIGAYVSIPLPGSARRANAEAALAQSEVASQREAAVQQKISAEAATLYQTATAAYAMGQAAQAAAEHLSEAATMTARAYQLGEGSLNDLLAARRLANEAQLNSRLQQLEAQELRYRLMLDAHRLWDLD